jgi:uncharacterized protein YbaP (TraB family)
LLFMAISGFVFCPAADSPAREINEKPPAIPQESGTTSEDQTPSPGFIWKTNINQSTFYLVGSIHAGKEAYYPLPEKYLDCYRNADVMIMELEDDFNTLEEKMLNYAEKDRLPEEQYFRHHLDSATIEQILRVMDREEFLKYDQYEGWLLNMILSGTRHRLFGFHSDWGVDMYFRKMAEEDNKPVIGLDRYEDQFALFKFDVPYEAQVQLIQRIAGSLEMQAGAERPLLEAYFSYDPDQFEKVFVSIYDFENPTVQRVYERIFTERNKKWVNRIEEISRGDPKTYMVLVGAGHFFGPDNVRELLTLKGYPVESP